MIVYRKGALSNKQSICRASQYSMLLLQTAGNKILTNATAAEPKPQVIFTFHSGTIKVIEMRFRCRVGKPKCLDNTQK
jgi:hypothetical protein